MPPYYTALSRNTPTAFKNFTLKIQSTKRAPPRASLIHHFSTSTSRSTSTQTSSTSGSSLANKLTLITGASRGIGLAIATRFALEGATCILVGRNHEALKAVREGLAGEGHSELVGDVGRGEFWDGVRREVRGIDILVNAAGTTHYSPLFVTSVESLEGIVRTNLMGTMLACRTVGKGMMKDGGCIINVASLLGAKGGTGSVGYAASKAGVIGLTRALAAEVGKANIRVNVIVPGYIETDMTAAMTPESRSNAINAIPLRRFGQPSEIADAAVFLAANKYANNCVLNLDGGLSAT